MKASSGIPETTPAKPTGSARHIPTGIGPRVSGPREEEEPANPRPEVEQLQGTFSPGSSTGVIYGYARVSRGDSQTIDRQIADLTTAHGATRVFTDDISGTKAAGTRPGYVSLTSHLRDGDVVAVTELSRLSRSLADLMITLQDLVEVRKVTVRVAGLGDFDARNPTTRLLWQVLGAVAELERSLISERTLSGLAQAKRNGVRIGRPPAADDTARKMIRAMRASGVSVAKIGAAVSMSERTVRRVLALNE